MDFLPLISSLTLSRWICFARHLSPSPKPHKGGSSIHFPLVIKPSWLQLFSVCYRTLNVNPQCSQIFPELHSCSPSFCSAALHVSRGSLLKSPLFPVTSNSWPHAWVRKKKGSLIKLGNYVLSFPSSLLPEHSVTKTQCLFSFPILFLSFDPQSLWPEILCMPLTTKTSLL